MTSRTFIVTAAASRTWSQVEYGRIAVEIEGESEADAIDNFKVRFESGDDDLWDYYKPIEADMREMSGSDIDMASVRIDEAVETSNA